MAVVGTHPPTAALCPTTMLTKAADFEQLATE